MRGRLAILRASLGERGIVYEAAFQTWATVGAFLVALLMVSRVSYPHLTKQILRGGRTTVPLLLTSAVLLVLAREAAVAMLFWGYALLGAGRYVAAWVAKRDKLLAGRRG